MKKFILCVAAGYALVFTLFIGLPQMMGGRGGTLTPQSGSRQAASVMPQSASAGQAQPQNDGVKTPLKTELPPDQKPLERYETGPVETFYRNGTLSSEWISDQNGGGVFRTYTPEGRPWMEMPFANDALDGELKTFYAEGPLFSRENYTAGERKGSVYWQYKNGNPWLEMSCNPNGAWLLAVLYSEEGQRADLPAVNTEQNTGYFKAFDENGREVINWQKAEGKQNLILKSYYRSGVLSAEAGLKDHQLLGRMVRYYPDGTVWMETEFLEDGSLPSVSVYFENKVLAFTQTAILAPEAGLEWKAFYPDGKIFWELTRFAGNEQTFVFQLATHWQDETSADANKERALL